MGPRKVRRGPNGDLSLSFDKARCLSSAMRRWESSARTRAPTPRSWRSWPRCRHGKGGALTGTVVPRTRNRGVCGIGGGWYGATALADRVGGTVWEVPLVGWFGVWGQHLGLGGGAGKSVDCAPAGIGFGGGLHVSVFDFV